MKTRFLLLLIFSFTLLTGCAARSAVAPSAPPGESMGAPAITSQSVVAPEAAKNSGADTRTTTGSAASSSPEPDTRIVIRNADLSIIVENPADALNKVTKLTEDLKGYVVSSRFFKTRSSGGVDLPEARITIRVPAQSLNDALTRIKALVADPATDIKTETVTGQDVTKEYTDLQSRLTNLQTAEKQLEKIMNSAVKTEDVLAVYKQLVSTREQIEVIKGQIKYYEQSSSFSAINVTIQSRASIQPLSIGGWEPVGVARDAIQALINTMQFFVSALIWIVLFFLPVLLCLAIPVVIVVLIARRIYKSRKTHKTTPPAVDNTI